MMDSDIRTEYVPEAPRNLKADEREWTVVLPLCPPGHHLEIELPRHHGVREPVVRIVKNPKTEHDKYVEKLAKERHERHKEADRQHGTGGG